MTDVEENVSDVEVDQEEDDDTVELEKRMKEKEDAEKKGTTRPKREQTNIKMVFGRDYKEFGPGPKLFKCAEYLFTTKFNGKDNPEDKLAGKQPSKKQKKMIDSYYATKKLVEETLPTLDEPMKAKLKAAYGASKDAFGKINVAWKAECQQWTKDNKEQSQQMADARKKKRKETDEAKKNLKSSELALPTNALKTVKMISEFKTYIVDMVNKGCDDMQNNFMNMVAEAPRITAA